MTTRTCGFSFTSTGRPCGNRVAEGAPWCRAGHPCASTAASDEVLSAALDRSGVRLRRSQPAGCGARPGDRERRATDLLRQAMASEDAEQHGLRADHVLADDGTALTLLGGADASPAARAAVVQRFGRVGALLVLGYEERARNLHAGPDKNGHGATGNGAHGHSANGHRSNSHGGDGPEPDRHFEPLLRDFAYLDTRGLYQLLGEIDRDTGYGLDDDVADAHRWLHATYAVAARDGTPGTHLAYMRALDRVMRLARPKVAS